MPKIHAEELRSKPQTNSSWSFFSWLSTCRVKKATLDLNSDYIAAITTLCNQPGNITGEPVRSIFNHIPHKKIIADLNHKNDGIVFLNAFGGYISSSMDYMHPTLLTHLCRLLAEKPETNASTHNPEHLVHWDENPNKHQFKLLVKHIRYLLPEDFRVRTFYINIEELQKHVLHYYSHSIHQNNLDEINYGGICLHMINEHQLFLALNHLKTLQNEVGNALIAQLTELQHLTYWPGYQKKQMAIADAINSLFDNMPTLFPLALSTAINDENSQLFTALNMPLLIKKTSSSSIQQLSLLTAKDKLSKLGSPGNNISEQLDELNRNNGCCCLFWRSNHQKLSDSLKIINAPFFSRADLKDVSERLSSNNGP